MTHLRIRPATAADIAALSALAARTFGETFAADNTPEDLALHLAASYGADQQGRELADPDVRTLLADTGDGLAGFAQLRRATAPSCVTGDAPVELWRFYVAREWQGRGVAPPLMQRVEQEAAHLGGRTLWLGVWERNPRAIAFYEKCGFRDVGSQVFMVGTDPQTDRVMVRAVAEAAPPPMVQVMCEDAATLRLPPMDAPFPCLLWDATGAWSDAARAHVVRTLIDAGCRYAVCAGEDCERWHDRFDEECVERELAGTATDGAFVMTSWHEGQAPQVVADFLVAYTDFDAHVFERYVVVQLGRDPVLAADLQRAVEAALRDRADES